MRRIEAFWESRGPVAWLLAPLALLFCGVAALRRAAYRSGLAETRRLPRPVVVVGNLTVGGSGKTPLVIALVDALRARGYRPGVVSRGYGGRSATWPRAVAPDSDPAEVGEEPVLIALRARCPVWVGPDRPAAAEALLARHPEVDLVLSDDGLQHYRLARDVEIAVVDGRRGLGNRWCLPAGPLREPPSRLASVDLVVINGGHREGGFAMTLEPGAPWSLAGPGALGSADALQGPVHAVAGIGDPERFFLTLERAGLDLRRHPFADHHPYAAADLDFADALPIVMTEKDAIKCRPFARPGMWALPVDARLDEGLVPALLDRLQEARRG